VPSQSCNSIKPPNSQCLKNCNVKRCILASTDPWIGNSRTWAQKETPHSLPHGATDN